MKEHPILFSTPMVQAILEGRKTQTRRVVKKVVPENVTTIYRYNKTGQFTLWENRRIVSQIGESPYGQPGDRLWVRETFVPDYFDDLIHAYKADWNSTAAEYVSEPKWKPSIHMPRYAARIWLEIEEVKVERVQDISEEDAKAEGVFPDSYMGISPLVRGKENSFAFRDLWCCTYSDESWEANPWVWVVKFKVLSITGIKSTTPSNTQANTPPPVKAGKLKNGQNIHAL